MLVLHCGLDIPVTHCSHDSRQVPGSLENSSPIVVPAAIENKIFGKPGFSSGFPEPIRHRREVSALCSLRWEDPSFASCAAPRFQDVECTIAHRHPSSPLCCLAVGNEDDAASPQSKCSIRIRYSSLSFLIPVSRIRITMSWKSCRLRFRQLHSAAPAKSFFSASSSSLRERPYSFFNFNFGAWRISFHSSAL